MNDYHVDPDIRKAETLPGIYYSDQEVFEKSKHSIFSTFWQYIGDQDDIVNPGSVCPKTILPGFVDEPLLLTRDLMDQTHCMSNVCTHRANLVVETPGVAERTLRCRYHGRKFKLDGTFESMPEFDEVENFPTERDNLAPLQLHSLGPLLFSAVDPRISFEEYIQPVLDRVSFLPLDEFEYDASRSRDYLVQSHWALYVENYNEGFHIPYVHSSLNEVLDYGDYHTELFDYANLQLGIAEGGESVFDLPPDHPDAGTDMAAYYFWLFPNLMLNFYPWGLSLNLVQPLDINRTKVSFRTYIWKPELMEKGAGAGLDRVEREDEVIVENVAKGLKSQLYSKGRYSPTREQGVHQFHQLLAEFSK